MVLGWFSEEDIAVKLPWIACCVTTRLAASVNQLLVEKLTPLLLFTRMVTNHSQTSFHLHAQWSLHVAYTHHGSVRMVAHSQASCAVQAKH